MLGEIIEKHIIYIRRKIIMQGKSKILGVGRYLPERIVTNYDIAEQAITSPAWIKANIGIDERRFSNEQETQAFMGAAAAREAINRANCNADELDIILVTTNVPDYQIPSTACLIQRDIGASNAFATDLITACPGFPMALSMADAYLHSGQARKVMVIATEALSKLTDPLDRTIYSILGDGAAALILGRNETTSSGILKTFARTVGEHWDAIYIPTGGVVDRPTADKIKSKHHCIKMDGSRVKKLVQQYFPLAIEKTLQNSGITLDEIDWLIPHQANLKLIMEESEKLGISKDKVITNIDRYGNTSSASIPIALYDLIGSGKLRQGHTILMPAFGAGFGYGAVLYRW